MDSYTLFGKVILPDGIMDSGLVHVSNGKITAVEDETNPPQEYIDLQGKWICPGFIDIHLHGVDGYDFMDGSQLSFKAIQKAVPGYGVTSFLATSRTASEGNIKNFLSISSKISLQPNHEGAELLGVHLEGPWINPEFSGAQNTGLIQSPELSKVMPLTETFKDLIKLVTLAPEVQGAEETIKYLSGKGIVVSAGHSAATFEEIEKSISSGVKHVTHCFNGMSVFHHRNPGLAFAAMHFEELTCELIADGLHVHPEVIKFLYKIKSSEGIILISDCTGANKLNDGTHQVGGKTIFKKGKKVALHNGTLAGSAITLIDAVRYLIREIGIPVQEVIKMASANPAQAIAPEQKKGKIASGYDADLVILDENFNVSMTIIGGNISYKQK
jgi:N-acetylglucosamine-6-phosphate deacetylase